MVETVSNSIYQVRKEIAQLPQAPSEDPSIELVTLCVGFTNELRLFTTGHAGCEILIQGATKVYQSFGDELRQTSPHFIPFTSNDGKSSDFKELADEGTHEKESDTINAERRFTANLDDVRLSIQK